MVPFVDILLVNNLYIFSIFLDGLNLIKGTVFVACNILNIVSRGIIYSTTGLIVISTLVNPFVIKFNSLFRSLKILLKRETLSSVRIKFESINSLDLDISCNCLDANSEPLLISCLYR